MMRKIEFPTPVDESLPQFRDLVFLIVDDNTDGRFLVAKTLLRKFPRSTVVECQSEDAAFRELETRPVSLIICHRTFDLDGLTLVRELRARAPSAPILMTSGIDRQEAAFAAGANAFLTYEEWLMVGNHVARFLSEWYGAESARQN